ncbi:hypothetical protein SAMD00019534_111150 [Acytostelium subglobosum LB1]|uniref:hypothetical protein n=1 Tax=Acytostelium subglobosum LB1 TaxID=1410327 RepID=UPI0006448746|nr:hypothetical protein SAMD00019534_111150 [Acytostelium subglobosum LB1]GAM27939.1 hypothetical protein SAMD00019534_111150 [Acytostelium subglobosum LB1]|eukprot:XP_012749222.1 hypothetical protein SAMD00019534_111150 [Acytostelium subglobosum LB1]
MFGIPSCRPSSSTYERWDYAPPIANPVERDLSEVRSPTGCYMIKNIDQMHTLEIGSTVLQSYYSDSQECVVWYTGSDGRVYYTYDRETYHLCAYSKAEFDTRVVLESDLWFIGRQTSVKGLEAKANTLRKKDMIQLSLYVEYFITMTEDERNKKLEWD